MCTSPSSPPQTPVTTVDEPHTRPVKSPLSTCPSAPTEYARPPQPDSPSQLPAPPMPPAPTSHHSALSTTISMPAIQSKVQPNSPPQNLSTTSTSIDSNPSCLILPEPATLLRRDHPVQVSCQPFDSAIVDPLPLSTNSRQSITPSLSFPGASNSATTCQYIFSDCTDSNYTFPTASSTESILASSQRTPNVYINGLPPHLSEQDLFALAQPFGDVRSVRTFTRHVSEKPTGYGFVLFGDVESAQRCIDGLRKCRNLHPSFSKQVHRIPGTEYAQHSIAQSADQDDNSFKSRMEKLKDTSSTNLYIEGLPLSIDEESLNALMKPHKIKSSRFFKTKLSDPPRIIAFVRLETRTAAEETIERLHGRMVRGWNDPGCRISVRFADSSEQRELRRTERTLKNGDQSPSRLTIAQAALLNLRGQELRAGVRDVAEGKPQRLLTSRMDKGAAFHTHSDLGLLPTSHSLPSNMCRATRESPLLSPPVLPDTSEMDALLQSIQNMGYDDGPLESTMKNLAFDNEYVVTQQAQLRALANAALLSPNPPPVTLPRGHTQARNGFTVAEELILEAHTQRLQLQSQLSQFSSGFEPISSSRKPNANVRGFNSASYQPLQTSAHTGKPMFSQDTLPSISEDEFHAMSRPHYSLAPPHEFQGPDVCCPSDARAAMDAVLVRPPSRAVSIVPPPPDYEESGKRTKGHHQRAERSTGPKLLSCPSSFSNHQPIPLGESRSHLSLPQVPACPNNINNSSSGDDVNNSTSTISCEKNIEGKHTYMHSHGDTRNSPNENKGPRIRSLPTSHIYTTKSPKPGEHPLTIKEGPRSPAVVSPALTYSSRTPSTLSPATPFFGSFVGSQDAFEVMTMENEDVAERKLKARVANK